MSDARIAWPQKTRDIHNHHMNSTIWDRFAFRDDDVIVATYGKSGTTWTQQIVGQLVFAGDPSVKISEISPWLDRGSCRPTSWSCWRPRRTGGSSRPTCRWTP